MTGATPPAARPGSPAGSHPADRRTGAAGAGRVSGTEPTGAGVGHAGEGGRAGWVTSALARVARRRVWLCDFDGTLVDSFPAHEAAFRQAIAEIVPDRLAGFRYGEHAGASTAAVAAGLARDAEVAARLARRKQRLYRAYAESGLVRPFPGTRRLLDRLAATERVACLVTSGSRASVERVLAACGLEGAFRGVLTADDVPVSKPDPRFYGLACRRWDVDAAEAVALEDSAHGVASAVGAGLATIHVHTAEPAPGAVAAGSLHELVSLLEVDL